MLTDLVGKEGNKLIERMTGEVTNPDEYRAEYGSRVDGGAPWSYRCSKSLDPRS